MIGLTVKASLVIKSIINEVNKITETSIILNRDQINVLYRKLYIFNIKSFNVAIFI